MTRTRTDAFAQQNGRAAGAHPGGKTRILIVEDEALTVLALKHELAELGYEIAGDASTAADAPKRIAFRAKSRCANQPPRPHRM